MKNFLLVVTLLLSSSFLTAQTPKYKVLDEKNPLIGDWEWIKDPLSSPYAAVPDIDFAFLRFSAGTKPSFGAVSFDSTRGFGCPTYFLAYSNGSTIMGTISDCCVAADKGKKISFNYHYDSATDQLVIVMNDEEYFYRRKI